MATPGLRERKKARTRRLIADTAARLFAERGYENVAVSDVAREAEVAEQTVYNYFPTKERLVTDRDEQIQDRLCDLVRSRSPGVTAAAAIREFVLRSVDGIRTIPREVWRGELGHLAAISPTVRSKRASRPGALKKQRRRPTAANIGARSGSGSGTAPRDLQTQRVPTRSRPGLS